MLSREHPILLIDGDCALCNRTAKFVILQDAEAKFLFAALQSDRAAELLRERGLPPPPPGTFVLIEGTEAYYRSEGALRVLRNLRFPWCVVGSMGLKIPRWIRDMVYSLVARFRILVFGKTKSCGLMSAAERRRFLDVG